MAGRIVAIGGAEFSMRPENEALHDYVTGLVRDREHPKICLLPTASGDPQEQITAFHAAMDRRKCRPSSISLFRLGIAPVNLRAHLLSQDVIYVGGGSLVNLLALWREHGIDEIVREAHERGILLCGYSAGSMCWFEHGVSRGGGTPEPTEGLGLLRGSHCVHYAQDPGRRDAYRKLVGGGRLPAGLALDDHAAALIDGGRIVEVVRARESSSAFHVESAGADKACEKRLEARLLPPAKPRTEPGLEEMRALRLMRSGAAAGVGGRRIGRGR